MHNSQNAEFARMDQHGFAEQMPLGLRPEAAVEISKPVRARPPRQSHMLGHRSRLRNRPKLARLVRV